MRSPVAPTAAAARSKAFFSKLMIYLILTVSGVYVVYTLKLLASSAACGGDRDFTVTNRVDATAIVQAEQPRSGPEARKGTNLSHVVFVIAESAKLWETRKNYIKTWYNATAMRNAVWLDTDPAATRIRPGSPTNPISSDTTRFLYSNKQDHRSAIRISRIVSETLCLARRLLQNAVWHVVNGANGSLTELVGLSVHAPYLENAVVLTAIG